MPIHTDMNRIIVSGGLTNADWCRLLAAMHNLTSQKGYQDIELDFRECTKAFAHEMVGLCATAQSLWKAGIDITLRLPTDHALARLFRNANWAHLIDFRSHEESRFRGVTHVPTVRFSNAREQYDAVNRAVDLLLSALSHFRRDDLRAIEWSLNEITDNVINHSESACGGFVQLTNYRQREIVEFVVGDAGIGVPNSLRSGRYPHAADSEALDMAIREGVTRDKSVGQGNGLYGSWQIAQKSGGEFNLASGWAALISSEKHGLRISQRDVPFSGTLVTCRIGYSELVDLRDALTFDGRVHEPLDYVETHFATEADGSIIVDLAVEAAGFGSRSSGDPIRKKLLNLIKCSAASRIAVDMEGVALVSSSFADEVFGKMFAELGPIDFARCVTLRNVDPLVKSLIDKAILQRMRQEA